MCGRTACTLDPDDICKACSFKSKTVSSKGRQQPVWRDPPGGQHYYPSYNVAPGSHTPVIISSQHYQGDLDLITERVIQPMQWGLVPSWHKGDPKNVGYETNNCRSEGMLEKNTFKIPLEKGRRCVVLADGFYEWKRDKDKKQPYFIYFPQDTWVKKEQTEIKQEESDQNFNIKQEPCDQNPKEPMKTEKLEIKQEILDENCSMKEKSHGEETKSGDRRLLTMAGVFDIWMPPDNSAPIYSYSVITVESSSAMSWIHHRMPAMLTNNDEIDEWLNFGEIPLRKAVQNIRAIEDLQMHPVTTAVGNSRYKSPDCVQPVDLKKPKGPVNSIMKNWLSTPKKQKDDNYQANTPTKATSPSKKISPVKQSKSSNLMMNWLSKGKKEQDEEWNSPAKKKKNDV